MALPLRRQFIILNAVIVLPVFAIIGWSARQTYNEHLQHLAGEADAVAETVVVYLERGLDIIAVQRVIEAVPLPEGSVITITDARSMVLARSRDPERYVGRQVDQQPLAVLEVPHTVTRAGVDGVERIYSNAPVKEGSLLVSAGIPTDVAWQRVYPIFRRSVVVTVGATLLVLLVEFFVINRYVRAFAHAARSAARVADGDLSPHAMLKMPSSELERLQLSFGEMVRKLRQAREALSAQVAEERRIREELELLQRQVIRQERLAAIGVLVSGVAHELNNPLQAILGFAELLQMRRDLPPQTRADLELIQKESARASAIIRNLSRFSRQQTPDATLITLREVVASVLELRQRKLEESHIELYVDDRSTQVLMAVFTELQQVLLNFMINAEQAVIRADAPRRITLRTMDVDDRVRLELEDTGPGVPKENEAKLFQPFFTTKPAGEGTGLGLSISYGIIQSHGGTIGYRSAEGGGAVFFFELPTAKVPAAADTPS